MTQAQFIDSRHRRAAQADAQAAALRSSLHRHRPLLLQLDGRNAFTDAQLLGPAVSSGLDWPR